MKYFLFTLPSGRKVVGGGSNKMLALKGLIYEGKIDKTESVASIGYEVSEKEYNRFMGIVSEEAV